MNLRHLNARLVDTGFEGVREDLSLDEIKGMLRRVFDAIDFDQAKADAIPFINIRLLWISGAWISLLR